MSTEENKALLKRWFGSAWQAGDLGAMIDEVWAEDIVIHWPDRKLEGRDEFKDYLADLKAALHDGQVTINAMIAEGDRVAVHWTFSATHAGEFMGIAPTGKRITATSTAIARIVKGKVAELYENYDALGMMQQIGAL